MVTRCPAGHSLVDQRERQVLYACDRCRRRRCGRFGCRACDFDLCTACIQARPPTSLLPGVGDASHVAATPLTVYSGSRGHGEQIIAEYAEICPSSRAKTHSYLIHTNSAGRSMLYDKRGSSERVMFGDYKQRELKGLLQRIKVIHAAPDEIVAHELLTTHTDEHGECVTIDGSSTGLQAEYAFNRAGERYGTLVLHRDASSDWAYYQQFVRVLQGP
eukprot:gnl/TRDRNA2_/TRDRNA2_196932_c0_seq1.p1 gnl/TRDRNA2_/TRDRNA2_196932_c0~~gnl/TRDRNA2_/TRDRNA2_196932_c0_seq1.p1  ORF type:complete len:217 (-),score=24.09 gnl/TRDRNA2_/TRDRNA2_196932_c0_seq1:119-769(-)